MSRIAVLMGGQSAEREVSLVSGRAASDALLRLGHQVVEIDADAQLAQHIVQAKPDAVFNALHGRWGEDGCVQGLLEVLRLPYTHSGVLASAAAMHKPTAKALLEPHGVAMAAGAVVSAAEAMAGDPLPRPFVVKPLNEGSSVGVFIVRDGDNAWPPAAWPFGDAVLVEAYVPGRELTVAVLGDRALAVTEIDTGRVFYDYDAKYAAGGSNHTLPADVPTYVADTAKEWALTAHRVLGCRGATRSDFRYDPATGTVVFLEINTQPGLTPTSLVPEQAQYVGIGFDALVAWMVEQARCDG